MNKINPFALALLIFTVMHFTKLSTVSRIDASYTGSRGDRPWTKEEIKGEAKRLESEVRNENYRVGTIAMIANSISDDLKKEGWIALSGQKIYEEQYPKLFLMYKESHPKMCVQDYCTNLDTNSQFLDAEDRQVNFRAVHVIRAF